MSAYYGRAYREGFMSELHEACPTCGCKRGNPYIFLSWRWFAFIDGKWSGEAMKRRLITFFATKQ